MDVLDSVSRVANAVTTPEQQMLARELRALLAAYREARDLIEIGAYRPGTNPLVDRAVERREAIDAFLRQGIHETSLPGEAWAQLAAVLAEAPEPEPAPATPFSAPVFASGGVL